MVVSFFDPIAWCFLRFFSVSAAISIFSFNVCLSIFDSFSGAWFSPIRLMSGSIVFVTFFVIGKNAFVTLCGFDVVDLSILTLDENTSDCSTVVGFNVLEMLCDDDDINCISSRWFSPFTSRVIFRKKLPTLFKAPRVSVIRLNADCDNNLACSSFWRRRRTFGNG